ncbi:MAG: eukaryotic translation initiation factor 3 subunit A [Geoglossum umbratile]|nr:MAG: eukaryotic translation initiation factor 3 subunit A [Geoglossum umbratile]
MPPPPHTKPENVLKRAQELIAVGQAQAALSLLHEHVTSKRSRNSPITSLEPVMILFVELCVDLRKGKSAKDGLYQYKNIAQNTNVGTIEMVLKKFIELSEQKVTEAQSKADEVQSTIDSAAAASSIEDLEASETPESILLSTVSGEQSRDRTDRAIVTPWLKFLWETYRTVLDILRNNARLEIMYQTTALQAFQFCLKYARKTEFRRLCELLRNHVQNAAKYSSQMHAINLNDPDTLQRHLDTRFQQLNVAVELELWQEAFRSVEDIHTLLNLSKRPAKNIMMANYYEKLTRIFLVSGNYLFHAAAWSRYYNLLRASVNAVASGQSVKKDSPNTTEGDLTRAASFVLLSALAIPVISTSRSRGALVDVDEAKKNKNTRLTALLGMSTAPTRAVLFKDALSKGLLKRARPEIRELYNILEVDFHPLSICKKISPILTQIGSDPEMEKYVLPLQQVILTRLFQQLSQVYESVELKFVYELAQFPQPFQVNSDTIEKFIMNGCKKGDLSIRIDHATGILSFDSDVFSAKAQNSASTSGSADSEASSVQKLQSTPSDIVRTQLTRLAKALYITCQYVDPTHSRAREEAKAIAFARAKAGAEKEHREALARREIIEKKKAAASSALAAKEKEEANKKRLRAQQLQEAESQRLADEQKERERKRIQAEQDRIRQEELKKQLDDLKSGIKGLDVGDMDLSELDSNRLRAIKLAQLEKEKNELSERLRITGKRIDHLERAFRREEITLLPKDYEAQRERDLAAYEKTKVETLKAAEEKHKDDLALKHRLARLVPAYEKFRSDVHERRYEEFEARRKSAQKELQKQMEKRKREHREKKAREKREREEAARKAREEEERLAREAEEKRIQEEEDKRKREEERAKRAEETRKQNEIAAKQRQREQEAEERRAKEKATKAETRAFDRPRDIERPAATRPPVIPLPAGKPSWRDREAAKEAASQSREAPPPDTDGRSKWVPSARRGRTAAQDTPPSDPRSDTPDSRERIPPARDGPSRTSAPRGNLMRDQSPGDVAPLPRSDNAFKPPALRDQAPRDASPSDLTPPPRSDGPYRTSTLRSQAPRDGSPSDAAPGKYRLGAMSGRRPGGFGDRDSGNEPDRNRSRDARPTDGRWRT